MRFTDFCLSPASFGAAAITAAGIGLAMIAWPAGRPSIEDMPIVFEEVTVTASPLPDGVTARLVPARETWLRGETLALEAVIENHGDAAEAVSAFGTFDLSVEHLSGPAPMGLGGMTFLTLAEAREPAPLTLAPGASASRMITVAGEAPFDQPGRYRVQGTWQDGDRRVDVPAFEVIVAERELVAAAPSPRRSPGA